MHCTLLVPDLLPPGLRDAPQLQLRVPRLAALLARGTAETSPAAGIEAWLCENFGVARQRDWPIAPLTLAADGGEPAGGYWLRCDPVHFQLNQTRMYLSGSAGVPSDLESQALVAALNAHFHDDGLLFRAGHDGRCYVRDDRHNDLTTHPLSTVTDHDIDALMPAGTDSGYWRRVLNEIQMALHEHPVNLERESRGLPAFNSVWLWGGGRAPGAGVTSYTSVWTNQALARALAMNCATPVAALPPDAATVIEAGGQPLAVLTAASDAGRDFNAWQTALEQLERDWFVPCYFALRQHRLTELTIVASGGQHSRRFEISARNLWRYWRRARALDAYA